MKRGTSDTKAGIFEFSSVLLPMLLLAWLSACGLTKFNKDLIAGATSAAKINHAPVVSAPAVYVPFNTASVVTLSGTDTEGDTLTYSVTGVGPLHGSLSGTAPNLSYTPSVGYAGPDSFTFKANDGAADSNTATVSLTVYRPLTINAPSISIPISSAATYTFVPSGGVLPYTFNVSSGSGSVSADGIYTAGTEGISAVVRTSDAIGNQVDSAIALTPDLSNGIVNAQVVDSSGERYLGGEFTAIHPYNLNYAAALNTTTGAPELAFDLQSGFNGAIYAVVQDPASGAIYVGGNFTTYRGATANYIAKLSALGVLDSSFNGSGVGFDSGVYALVLNSTGTTLYVGGGFTTYRAVANSAKRIAKLSTSDGAIDTSFHPVSASGGFDRWVNALALNASGTTLYAGGDFTTYRTAANSANRIAKLSTSDGALDAAFHPLSASGGFNNEVYALALNAAGTTLYAGGYFTTYRAVLNSARYVAKLATGDGAIDTNFHPLSPTGGFSTYVYALALNSTGTTLYAGGRFTTYRGVADSAHKIAKLSTSDGAIDTTFHPVSASGGFAAMSMAKVGALALSADDATLYVGHGTSGGYRGVANSANHITKLATSDGAIDTSFHPVSASGGFNNEVYALALNATGTTLYAGGEFTYYRGNNAAYLARLSPSGILDTAFHGAGSGFDDRVRALALNSTGSTLYVGGSFTSYQGVANSARYIAKLSTRDGAMDTSFHPASASGGFDGEVYALALNSAGTTLYAGGSFTTYRTVANSAKSIAKLSTSDGALDASFHPISASGGFDGNVYALALNAAGTALYAGGDFSTYRGVNNSAHFIAKLATGDGAIDTNFHPVSASGGFSQWVSALALNSAGTTLYAGGVFSTYRGVASSALFIAKLSTSDGALDTTFHPISASGGFNGQVKALALNSTGTTLYAGGEFTTYRGVVDSAHFIAKLATSDGAIDSTFQPVSASGGFAGTAVNSLALNSTGTTLYVGGDFITYRGAQACYAEMLDTLDGSLLW